MKEIFPIFKQNLQIDNFGEMHVVCTDFNLVSIKLGHEENPQNSPLTKECVKQLTKYFRKELTRFDLPIKFESGTPFQLKVWSRLQEIKFGEAISYGMISDEFKMKHGSRAVGAANAKNPIPIVVPCHRVIGSDGKLTGYALGIERKRLLLEHEGYIKQVSLF